MLAIFFHVTAKPKMRQELFKFLTEDANVSKEIENGTTLLFDFFEDPENKNAFYVFEAYKDGKAFKIHKANKHYKIWNSKEFKKDIITNNKIIFKGEISKKKIALQTLFSISK